MHGGHHRLGSNLPVRYKRSLCPTLAEALQRQVEASADALALYEEIALARAFLEKQCELASVLYEQNGKVSLEAKAAATGMVREATSHVADLCTRMAAIERSRKDGIPLVQLGHFVEQVAAFIRGKLGDDTDVEALSDEIKAHLRLPGPDVDPGVTVEFQD
jgi:hypothetical protein